MEKKPETITSQLKKIGFTPKQVKKFFNHMYYLRWTARDIAFIELTEWTENGTATGEQAIRVWHVDDFGGFWEIKKDYFLKS